MVSPSSRSVPSVINEANNLEIHAFFSSWLTSIRTAMANSDQLITSIVQQFDPEKKTHVKLNWALTALGIGVGFIFSVVLGPEAIVAEGALAGVAEAAIQGIKKASGLAQSIWPVGTENSQLLQVLASQKGISSLEDALEGNVEEGLV